MINLVEQAIRDSWTADIAYPACQNDWSKDNPSFGQCAITSLVIHDFYGGKILFSKNNNHFWNVLPDGTEMDLTREQFKDVINVADAVEVSSELILNGERAEKAKTKERYEKLKSRTLLNLSIF
jgi:hypothetical protein